MKRIVLGALDYGVSFGVDRAIRSLVEKNRLSAVGCMVGTELWSRDYMPLKEVASSAGGRVMMGLTLAFTGDRVALLGKRLASMHREPPSRGYWNRRALVRLLPDDLMVEETKAQLAAFIERMEREPDFVSVRDGLLSRSGFIQIVMRALNEAGLQTKPVLVAPVPKGRQFRRLEHVASLSGFKLLPSAPALPFVADEDQLHRLLWQHFDGLEDMTFVSCMPGVIDDRLRRDEPLETLLVRECQQKVLASPEFFTLLEQKDLFLH